MVVFNATSCVFVAPKKLLAHSRPAAWVKKLRNLFFINERKPYQF